MMINIVILGVSADIGQNICKFYQKNEVNILATYRRDFSGRVDLERLKGVTLLQCDLTNPVDIKNLSNHFSTTGYCWDFLFSSVGTCEPIGRFFDLKFEDWAYSLDVNMISQLRAIHVLYPFRNKTKIVDVALLAGGGVNNAFRCYSAYCVAKIGLIKMCELIDDEAEDINIFILGPGFVKTKNHDETLRAGSKAEENYERVRKFMFSENRGTSFEDIFKCIEWSRQTGREVVGGRNLSVVHDSWGAEELVKELRRDNDMYKLRRFGNKEFSRS